MRVRSLSHLSDQTLRRDLATVVARDCTFTADVLAHIGEFDARRLYLPDGFRSMFVYCVDELHMSEDVACKRICAARTARRFPAIFDFVADGRLHLSAVVLLAPHLTPENADGLLAAATHKTKSLIEHLIAKRFPQPDVPTQVRALPGPSLTAVPIEAPRTGVDTIDSSAPGRILFHAVQHDPGPVDALPAPQPVEALQSSLERVQAPAPRPKVSPLSPERYAVRFTMSEAMHDKLRYAQDLLSHQIPSGDVAEVFERSLEAVIREQEKGKFAATDKPRKSPARSREGKPSGNPRYIPADVKRAVWQRDQGQCTFVSDAGLRCSARKFLEFDHVDEVARGGRASIGLIRLRCRSHNQYSAECTFGAEFMKNKREQARQDAAEARAKAAGGGAEVP